MRPKHIKTIWLFLLVLCSRAASASDAVYRQATAGTIIEQFNPSAQTDENEKITSLLIQCQVCEIEPQYEPAKTIAGQQAALPCYHKDLNIVFIAGYTYASTTHHYARLCRLMLFPRHGFW